MENTCKTGCSQLELNCFDAKKYTIFIIFSVIIPYILFQKVATHMQWKEKRNKTNTQHFETIIFSVILMTLLYVMGNYENTFGTSTAVITSATCLLFGAVAQNDFAKHTFKNMSIWGTGMKKLVTGSTILVISTIAYHVYLAGFIDKEFTKKYVSCLLVPIVLLVVAYALNNNQNNTNKNQKVVSKIHIHHWTIFYILAFFTRFPDLLSRVAAGVSIGSLMHGISAYNVDTTFEHETKHKALTRFI